MIKLISILIFLSISINSHGGVDLVKINKSEKTMYLMDGDKVIKKYKVAFGANPKGHKEEEGDEKTPEGRYSLGSIMEEGESSFYRSMLISYPNEEDKRRAKERGVDHGGNIRVHGQKNGLGWLSFISQRFNWTDGCIAIKNAEMDEFLELVANGTAIQINK